MNQKRIVGIAQLLVVALFTACGGGGSSSNGSSTQDPPPSSNPPAATAPGITTQPSNVTTTAGNTATFNVAASGSDPLSYQWQKNGTAISGATAASYTTPAVQLADDGALFSVVVTNSAGSVTSSGAKLSVTAPSGNGNAPSPADVTTYKNDVSRTGQYLVETTLTPANVNSTSFGLLRQLSVDGNVDAQPLYLSQLKIGGTAHNVVYVATENNSVYAFDADSGTQLWKVSLLAAGESVVNASDFPNACTQVSPILGITATPVIDRTAGANGTIYVVTMSKDAASDHHQRLHALDITTGAELLNGPTQITATSPNQAGIASFDPFQYEERAALLLANGTIYTTWTSHCDEPPYGGWIISFDQTTLARNGIGNVAPNSGIPLTGVPAGDNNDGSTYGPAIWMSGSGPAADSTGNVYFLTGNGRFETTLDANGFPNMGDYGNAFIKLTKSGATLSVADYFSSSDTVHLSALDQDLGGGGALLLPDLNDSTGAVKHLIVGAGKEARIYLVDRDNMGKFNASTNQIWQEVDGVLVGAIRSSPAYFNGTLYFGPLGQSLLAFTINNAKISTTPTSRSAVTFGYPGTSPTVSANGSSNGIVWTHASGGTGVLYAFDPANLAHELYDSNQAAGGRDHFGAGNKFIAPMIAGGKVFVGTTNSVAVFGLLGH
jgi:outer membrane protein assembly factor BamB